MLVWVGDCAITPPTADRRLDDRRILVDEKGVAFRLTRHLVTDQVKVPDGPKGPQKLPRGTPIYKGLHANRLVNAPANSNTL